MDASTNWKHSCDCRFDRWREFGCERSSYSVRVFMVRRCEDGVRNLRSLTDRIASILYITDLHTRSHTPPLVHRSICFWGPHGSDVRAYSGRCVQPSSGRSKHELVPRGGSLAIITRRLHGPHSAGAPPCATGPSPRQKLALRCGCCPREALACSPAPPAQCAPDGRKSSRARA